MTPLLASIALGYLLGSIPFGMIVTYLGDGRDIRTIGSGNIGTTNVLRTGRKSLAAMTLIGDMLKATLAVVIANHIWGADAGLASGAAAFVGHVFPVWLKFKGGKGVATYLGALIGVVWPVALIFAAVWVIVAKTTRYSSLSALAASLAAPIAVSAFASIYPTTLVFAGLSALLWAFHRENITRLLSGSESRIGQRAAATEES